MKFAPPPAVLLVTFAASVALLPTRAMAGDCCDDSAGPSQVPDSSLLWSGAACLDVCQDIDTGTEIDWECDTTRNGDGSVANAIVIYDGAGTICGKDYCAWGVAANGASFRCSIDADEGGETLTSVSLLGGSQGDALFFTYDDGTITRDLDTHGAAAVSARIAGRGGDDFTHGSFSTDADYSEQLFGGGHNDHMCGNDGDDFLNGNLGNDEVCGNDGDDTVVGDAGVDTLCGGPDKDHLSGGVGDDHLNYQSGPTGETNDGGSDYDYCNSSGDLNCEANHSSSPLSCP